MSEQSRETFQCGQCDAVFRWRPELAGKKVQCRCGALIPVPSRTAEMYPGRHAIASGDKEAEDEVPGGVIRNWAVPTALIVLGLVVGLLQVSWTAPEIRRRTDVFFGEMAFVLLVAVVVMVVGAMGAVRMMALNLGRPGPALFKIASIAVFGVSIAIMLARLDKDQSGWSLTGVSMGWVAMILIYWVFFGVLFKLEIHEVLLTVFIVAVAQAIALGALMA